MSEVKFTIYKAVSDILMSINGKIWLLYSCVSVSNGKIQLSMYLFKVNRRELISIVVELYIRSISPT